MQENNVLATESIQLAVEKILETAVSIYPDSFESIRRTLNVGFQDYFENNINGFPKVLLDTSSISIDEINQPIMDEINSFLRSYINAEGDPVELQKIICESVNRMLYPEYFATSLRPILELIKEDASYVNTQLIWNTKFPLLGLQTIKNNSDNFPYVDEIEIRAHFSDEHFVFPIHVARILGNYGLLKLLFEHGSRLVFHSNSYRFSRLRKCCPTFQSLNSIKHPVFMVIERGDYDFLKSMIEKAPNILTEVRSGRDYYSSNNTLAEYLVRTLKLEHIRAIFNIPGDIYQSNYELGRKNYNILKAALWTTKVQRKHRSQLLDYFLNECPNMQFDTTKKDEIKKLCDEIMLTDKKSDSGFLAKLLDSKAIDRADKPEYLQHCLLQQIDICSIQHVRSILSLGADPRATVVIDAKTKILTSKSSKFCIDSESIRAYSQLRELPNLIAEIGCGSKTLFEIYLTKAIQDQTKPYLHAVSYMLEHLPIDDPLINHEQLHLLYDRAISSGLDEAGPAYVRALAYLSSKNPKVCLAKIKKIFELNPGIELYTGHAGRLPADYALSNKNFELLKFILLNGGFIFLFNTEAIFMGSHNLVKISHMLNKMSKSSNVNVILSLSEELVKNHQEFCREYIVNMLNLHLQLEYLQRSPYRKCKTSFLPKLIEAYVENYPEDNDLRQQVESLLREYRPQLHPVSGGPLFTNDDEKQSFIAELQADVDDYQFAISFVNNRR